MAECIERETVVNNLELLARYEDRFRQSVILGIVKTIRTMEAADVVPVVHGYWIEKKSAVRQYFECSNCGAHENKHTAIKGYYCWRCGAKMDGGKSCE